MGDEVNIGTTKPTKRCIFENRTIFADQTNNIITT